MKLMKKILFSFLCAFGSTVLSHAQDLITTKDGSDIQAVILEVTTSEVKKYSNLDGPIFTMPKSDILIVRYENGENDVFAAPEVCSPARFLGCHLFGAHSADIVQEIAAHSA